MAHYQEFPENREITRLYPRHRTVLTLLCEGWSRKKIAVKLGLSVKTIEAHHEHIKNKPGHQYISQVTRTSI